MALEVLRSIRRGGTIAISWCGWLICRSRFAPNRICCTLVAAFVPLTFAEAGDFLRRIVGEPDSVGLTPVLRDAGRARVTHHRRTLGVCAAGQAQFDAAGVAKAV